jgi:hypothetical protein
MQEREQRSFLKFHHGCAIRNNAWINSIRRHSANCLGILSSWAFGHQVTSSSLRIEMTDCAIIIDSSV